MHSLRAAALLALLAAAPPAWAAGDATKVSDGRTLALQWCAECHLVEKGQAQAPADGVPTFFSIADHPTTTEMGLRAFLTTPHGKMPDIMLTRDQIVDIVAYILSLKAQ